MIWRVSRKRVIFLLMFIFFLLYFLYTAPSSSIFPDHNPIPLFLIQTFFLVILLMVLLIFTLLPSVPSLVLPSGESSTPSSSLASLPFHMIFLFLLLLLEILVSSPPYCTALDKEKRSIRVLTWLTDFLDHCSSSSTIYAGPTLTPITFPYFISSTFTSFLIAFLVKVSDLKGPYSACNYIEWIGAMDKELLALEENGTWILATPPEAKHALGCKWVYMVKLHPDGIVERFKAR